jgi:hypothetical protein
MGVNQVFDETEFYLLTSTNMVASCPVLAQACIMQWSTADITLIIQEIMCPARALWDKTADTMWPGINSALPMPILTMASHCKFFVWVGSHDPIIGNHSISNFVETGSTANVFPFRMPCGSNKFVLCLIPLVRLCMCQAFAHILQLREASETCATFLGCEVGLGAGCQLYPRPTRYRPTRYKHDLTHNNFMDTEQLARMLASDKAFVNMCINRANRYNLK